MLLHKNPRGCTDQTLRDNKEEGTENEKKMDFLL